MGMHWLCLAVVLAVVAALPGARAASRCPDGRVVDGNCAFVDPETCFQRVRIGQAEEACRALGQAGLCSREHIRDLRLGQHIFAGNGAPCGDPDNLDEKYLWTSTTCRRHGREGRIVFRLDPQGSKCETRSSSTRRFLCCGAEDAANPGPPAPVSCDSIGQDLDACQKSSDRCQFFFEKYKAGGVVGCKDAQRFCGFDSRATCMSRCNIQRCVWRGKQRGCELRENLPATTPLPQDVCSAQNVGDLKAVKGKCAAAGPNCVWACNQCRARSRVEEMSTAEKRKAPHIILSLADDMGWNDIGYHNPAIHTPRLNDLAENGIKLSRHYMFRFCSPSRSMLMTGMLPWRHGQQTDINFNPSTPLPCGLQEEIETLPEVLGRAGYRTHMLGKWHLGYYREKFLPVRRGFETHVGSPAGVPMVDNPPNELFKRERCSCAGSKPSACEWHRMTKCATAYKLWNSTREGGVKMVPPEAYLGVYDFADTLLAREGERIINAHNPDEPLFLFASWYAPHDPHDAPARYIEPNLARIGSNTCQQQVRLGLAGMMTALDEAHDILFRALQARDMWKDTLLVFMSDNGGFRGVDPVGSCPKTYKKRFAGNNFDLRGSKYTFWEGGIRVPAFVSGGANVLPNKVRGTTSRAVLSGVDWFRTLVRAANIAWETQPPFRQAVDSIDQWDALVKPDIIAPPRTELILQNFEDMDRFVILEQRDGALYKFISGYPGYIRGMQWNRADDGNSRFKVCDLPIVPVEMSPSQVPRSMDLSKTWSCVKKPCLFNLDADPSEQNNLAERPPSAAVSRLLSDFQERVAEVRSASISFPLSDFCHLIDDKLVLDPKCIDQARKCGHFVPWRPPEGFNAVLPCPPLQQSPASRTPASP